MPEIRSASDTRLDVSRAITLNPCLGGLLTKVAFGVVNKFTKPVLLGPTFIDEITESIHPIEMNIIPHHSPPVAILMVHEAKSESE